MRLTITMTLLILVGVGVVFSQAEFPGEDPPREEEEKAEGGTLLPRPDEDNSTALWVKSLGGLRQQGFTVAKGALINHTFSPKGDRFYYFRKTVKDDKTSFELFTVGIGRSETRVARTGGDATPPLFLPDNRIAFTTRLFDENEDGQIDILDAPTLMVSTLDGGRLRQIVILDDGDVPVAVWKNGEAILLATQRGESANGMIVSLDLQSKKREDVCEGFNVELVLAGDKLVIQRQQVTELEPDAPQRGWGRRQPAVEEEAPEITPVATLLDHSEHLIYDPADQSLTMLHSPSQRSEIVVKGDGTYFGIQENNPKDNERERRMGSSKPAIESARFEELIIDGPQHKTTLTPSKSRYQWRVIGHIEGRGPLILEHGNLGTKLLLQDKALKVHTIDEFDFFAKGFQCSADGKFIAWLVVEDTDKDGRLEPWEDHSKPYIAEIR